MKSILDSSFEYTDANHTDIRKTFARVRREMAQRESLTAPAADVPMLPSVAVLPIVRRRAKA